METPPAVYIADTFTINPPSVASEMLADVFFDRDRVGKQLNRLATRAAREFGISQRPTVLDLDRFPEIALCDDRHSSLHWGQDVVEHFLTELDIEDVGYLCVSYNISSHRDVMPNLACQIAMATGLRLDTPPLELPYYGCASGIFLLHSAVDYCRRNSKAAIVFCFDQCTWDVIQDLRREDPNIRKIIRSNLLFSDGGIGVLIAPETLRRRFKKPLPKILETKTAFEAGDVIGMVDGKFHVGDTVAQVMPDLIMAKLIDPASHDRQIDLESITEWSIHQGGPKVLNEIGCEDRLGLSEKQLGPSRALFHQYGNLSSASCLFVLDHHFHQPWHASRDGVQGAVLSFGAGYYLGLMVYRWER